MVADGTKLSDFNLMFTEEYERQNKTAGSQNSEEKQKQNSETVLFILSLILFGIHYCILTLLFKK